jgi:type II secretory pathway component GspD/PulD (secretin)
VTVEVVDVPVGQLLGMVGRRLGVEVSRTGQLFYLGTLKPEDKGVLVRRVGRLTSVELSSAVTCLLSEFGRVQTFGDGVVVVGDRVEVLQRVEELLTRLEAVESACWVMQLYLVSLSESDQRELSLNAQPAIDLAATLAASSAASTATGGAVNLASQNVAATGALSAVLKASRDSRTSRTVAEPLFVLVDGASASFNRGQRVPIAQQTVSDQGTVTTSGYSFINVGLGCDVAIREHGTDVVASMVKVEISRIESYVEKAPVTAVESFNCNALLCSGGVYLLGCLQRDERERGVKNIVGLGGASSDGGGTLQVWARVYRIGGGVNVEPPTPATPEPAAANVIPLPPVTLETSTQETALLLRR